LRVLLQRVTRASVTVDENVVASIDSGLVALIGITSNDTADVADMLAMKCANLRIFDDEGGVMNRSLLDLLAEGRPKSMLAVSQFTLYADCRKGRRPSYVNAARPEQALHLFEQFVAKITESGVPVSKGLFGAEMAVELVNDGPVTIWLDSDDLRRGV